MTSGNVARALEVALSAADLNDVDAATIALASQYAQQIDDGFDLHKLGPQLLSVLTEMGLTARARASIKSTYGAGRLDTDGDQSSVRVRFDDLRDRARQRNATVVEFPAS